MVESSALGTSGTCGVFRNKQHANKMFVQKEGLGFGGYLHIMYIYIYCIYIIYIE